tara:strand:+ start:730 stop:1038 length:309 start_codon:yes stop_codon:yes gene_type:complete
MSWLNIITTVLPLVVKAFSGGDEPQQQAADGMPKLVPKPTPFTPRKIPSFGEWKGTQLGMPNFSARGGTIQNVTPHLKSANPSTVEAQYWRAIFDTRKTRIT